MNKRLQRKVEKLRRLYEKATPGPWHRCGVTKRGVFTFGENEIISEGIAVVAWTGFDAADGTKAQKRANARFIVAAMNDMPALLSELQRVDRKDLR